MNKKSKQIFVNKRKLIKYIRIDEEGRNKMERKVHIIGKK